ncbi:hypothetical protein BgiMline_017610 [Biomphalaria glabrata]
MLLQLKEAAVVNWKITDISTPGAVNSSHFKLSFNSERLSFERCHWKKFEVVILLATLDHFSVGCTSPADDPRLCLLSFTIMTDSHQRL